MRIRGSPAAARDEALQAEVEAWLARSDLVGVTAAVATDDGAWAGAAGVDGIGQRLVPQSAMGIGSVTKTVTAAEVLLLAEQGLVDLDTPVADYVDVPFDTQGATVRQLLSMRSGFPDPTDEVFVAASEAGVDMDGQEPPRSARTSLSWMRWTIRNRRSPRGVLARDRGSPAPAAAPRR